MLELIGKLIYVRRGDTTTVTGGGLTATKSPFPNQITGKPEVEQ
jgi:hypothetical protein